MITATLYFKKDIDIDDLVKHLQGMPEVIKPIYFTADEGKIFKSNVLSDGVRYKKFLKENQSGFFLYTDHKVFFDISVRRANCVEITLYLDDSQGNGSVDVFFEKLANCNPIFGFACDEEEYNHRNRYYITIGMNQIEDWVGRDLGKYIPGVYWYTLLSDELLSKHGVDLTTLSAEAITTEALGDGSLHLLKFYENPEDWKENAERLDDLCERTDGVFSRRLVEAAIAGVSNYLEYDDIIAEWR